MLNILLNKQIYKQWNKLFATIYILLQYLSNNIKNFTHYMFTTIVSYF